MESGMRVLYILMECKHFLVQIVEKQKRENLTRPPDNSSS